MASGRVARAERALSSMEGKLGLTPEGKEWLIAAVDPYHDTPLKVCGYPDGNTAPCCSQIIKESFNIACPAGITTGTWDVMICMTPWAKAVRLFSGSRLSGTNSNPGNEVSVASTGVSTQIGGVFTIALPTGASFNPNASPASTSVVYGNSTIADQYFLGDTRVIAKGLEVHNTTSELNRQGMCTTFHSPVPNLDEAGTYTNYLNTAGAATSVNSASFIPMEMWPQSQSAAVLTPGSRQWTADQGLYIVPKLKNLVIPATNTGFAIQPFLIGQDLSNATQNLAPLGNTSGLVGSSVSSIPNVFWDNFEIVGGIFSGLSLQTTLTVNYTYIIERQPDWTISDLIVLVQPPPERDNIALDLYTHISDHLPVGVPVKENGLGDWFMDALSTAADFVAPVLSVLPVPGAGLIGSGISALNAAYKGGKKKENVFETNPYTPPPVTTIPRAPAWNQNTNRKGKVTMSLSGGSAKSRVQERQRLAVADAKIRNDVARERKIVKAINPFKGKSIPR